MKKIKTNDRILSMKIAKAIVFLLVSIFLFSAAGLCDAACSTDDDTQHCISCCSAGCHVAALSSARISIVPSLSASFIQFDAVFRQEPFLSGIEYPPNSLI